MKNFKELLQELNACQEGVKWVQDMPIEEFVKTCHRGDWLLWLAQKVGLDLRTLTLADARCAKTVVHLMKDESSIKAVEVKERFGEGKATLEELNTGAATAEAASDALEFSTEASSDAATYAAAAATYGATAAAIYTSHAAAADAYANTSSDGAGPSAVYAAAVARNRNQKQTADICREIFGEKLIELVNKKLNEKNHI